MAAAIKLVRTIDCPKISRRRIEALNQVHSEYVTRHFEGRYLQSYLDGYFRFGTLSNYRATEKAETGRLGDFTESRIKTVFNSSSGFHREARFGQGVFRNISISGFDEQISQEVTANDYCACVSSGAFDLGRAKKMQEAEQVEAKKPSGFVTYNRKKLNWAVHQHFLRTNNDRVLLSRPVEYQKKDWRFVVPQIYEAASVPDSIESWLAISFVKPPTFSYEEELRMLLVDRRSPGRLSKEADFLDVSASNAFAAAIVDSGEF